MLGPMAYHDTWTGLLNDVQEYKVPIPFDQVKVPTLILHGDHDGDVDFSNAEKAHAGIKDSELIIAKKGGHMLMINEGYKEHLAAQNEFIKKHF